MLIVLSACSQPATVSAPPAVEPTLPAATNVPATQPITPTALPNIASPHAIELPPSIALIGGIAVDRADNLLIADVDADIIYQIDPSGHLLMKFGGHGSGDGQFKFWNTDKTANGGYIAVDDQGNIFVADTENHRIQKFNSKGEYLTQWGKQGKADGELSEPYGIAVDSQGNVYVSELTTKRIQKFDNNGKFMGVIAKPDPNDVHDQPWWGITVDRTGNIYVGSAGGQILKFDSTGKLILSWGKDINSHTTVFHLITDDAGNLYVSDASRPYVVKIDPDGKLLGKFVWAGATEKSGAITAAINTKGDPYAGFVSVTGNGWASVVYAYQQQDLKPSQ